MKSIQLHPVSLLVGVGVTVLALFSMSQSPVVPTSIQKVAPPQSLIAPRAYIVVQEGVPYTVPANRLFVPTALGAASLNSSDSVSLAINGVVECNMEFDRSGPSGSPVGQVSMYALPNALVASAGSVVTVQTNCTVCPLEGRIWGYLVAP